MFRTQKSPLLILLSLTLLLTGCFSTNPLRIPDEEWKQLSREEQMRAYEKQAELDKVRLEAEARERAAQIEAEARKQQALLELRQNAEYGDLVQCVVEPLQVKFYSKWKPAQPFAFDLVRGETREVTIDDKQARSSTRAWVRFDESGQRVSLCSSEPGRYGSGNCDSLLGTSRDFHRGIERQIKVEEFAQGAMRCDLKPESRRGYRY